MRLALLKELVAFGFVVLCFLAILCLVVGALLGCGFIIVRMGRIINGRIWDSPK